eukprot:39437-Hanusia_phi.AAC.2
MNLQPLMRSCLALLHSTPASRETRLPPSKPGRAPSSARGPGAEPSNLLGSVHERERRKRQGQHAPCSAISPSANAAVLLSSRPSLCAHVSYSQTHARLLSSHIFCSSSLSRASGASSTFRACSLCQTVSS